jgi:glycosyltransferase involved in cell wall biosynthesis
MENEIQVILIHDIQDLRTGPEIREILKRLPSQSVTLVEKYFGSPGGSRNLGLNYVKGSWVNFVDSDDVFVPIELLKILRMSGSMNVDALISNYETIDSVTNLVNLEEHKKSWTKVALQPGLWRWTFLAQSIGSTRFSNLRMGEDQKFLYEFCQQEREIHFTDLTTYRYTTNQDFQLTNQSKPKRDLLDVLSEILQIRGLNQTNFDELTETMIIKLFISSIIHSTLRNRIKSIVIFFPLIIPFTKARLRYSKLDLRGWLQI